MAVMFIKNTLHTNRDSTEFTKVFNWLIIMSGAVNEVIRIIASRFGLAYATIGQKCQDLMVFEEVGGVCVGYLPATGFVWTDHGTTVGVLTDDFGDAIFTKSMPTVRKDNGLLILLVELFFAALAGEYEVHFLIYNLLL